MADHEVVALARVVAEALLELGRIRGLHVAHLGAEVPGDPLQALVGARVPAPIADRAGREQGDAETVRLAGVAGLAGHRGDGERGEERPDDLPAARHLARFR